MAKNFIDNRQFYEYLIIYKNTKDKDHEDFNLTKSREVHNELGKIFDLMTKKLLYSPKFINYSDDWKAEMYSEATYNCCRYMHNFNTVKNSNPFAYFTTVIWNSFLQMLNKEKKIIKQREIITDAVYESIEHLLPTNGQPIVADSNEIFREGPNSV